MQSMIDTWGTIGVHDPTIIKDDEHNQYYMFSTDTFVNQTYTSGVQIRKSPNLVNWEYIGTALDGVPSEAQEWSLAKGLWAPEVIKTERGYRMYYSASTFGSTRSCIGLAEAEQLEGPWHDRGIVVKTSKEIATHNAIDANVVMDRTGKPWMSYGSFFGGIYLLELDEITGFAKVPNDLGTRIAKRSHFVEGAIEGPFIYFNKDTDYYYLFTSYDSLVNTYNIRVSRSRDLQGPYLDVHGNDINDDSEMNAGNGVKIAGSVEFSDGIAWLAPGHNSIFTEDETCFIVHHIRIEGDKKHSYGMVREILWLPSGWPVLAPEYFSEKREVTENVNVEDLSGQWEYVVLDNKTDSIKATYLNWEDDSFQQFENNVFVSSKNSTEIIVFTAYDWSTRKKRLMFSGLTADGFAFFGKKVEASDN